MRRCRSREPGGSRTTRLSISRTWPYASVAVMRQRSADSRLRERPADATTKPVTRATAAMPAMIQPHGVEEVVESGAVAVARAVALGTAEALALAVGVEVDAVAVAATEGCCVLAGA